MKAIRFPITSERFSKHLITVRVKKNKTELMTKTKGKYLAYSGGINNMHVLP
jgi:hypothetical protein